MLIEKDKSALIIIDVQEKLVSAMPKPHMFIDNIIKLQEAAKILKLAVIYSEQYPKGLGQTIDRIRKNMGNLSTKIEKTEFAVSLKRMLTSKANIAHQNNFIICGIESHVCVLQTAISLATDKTFDDPKLKHLESFLCRVYVVQDAISSRFEKDYLTTLSRLDKYPNIEIVTAEMVLFEWLRNSKHKKFKEISSLIK